MRESMRCFESNPEFGEARNEGVPVSLKAQIDDAWKRAINEGAEFVRRHKRQSRNGQAVFDLMPRPLYVGIDLRLKNFPRTEAEARKLLEDIEKLIVYVQNYEWPGHFCLACGEPISRDRWYCYKCGPAAVKKAERDRHEYYQPADQVHKVKKGSAVKRGNGHAVNTNVRPRDRKKGKGGKSAKSAK